MRLADWSKAAVECAYKLSEPSRRSSTQSGHTALNKSAVHCRFREAGPTLIIGEVLDVKAHLVAGSIDARPGVGAFL